MLPYLGLFAVAFLAATVLPLGSEAALAALVLTNGSWPLALAWASLGNVLGSLTTFWLGWRAGLALERNPRLAQRSARTRRWVERWGAPVLLLAWLPGIGDLLVGLAGALRLPIIPCAVWLTLGKVARYAVVIWAALRVAG